MNILEQNYSSMMLLSCTDLLTTTNIKEVLDWTWDLRAKWMFIGIELHIDQGTLDAIGKDNKKAEDCLVELLNRWLRQPNATRSALTAALQSKKLAGEATSEQGMS